MKILIISGSRADAGILAPVKAALRTDPYFGVSELNLWGADFPYAFEMTDKELNDARPDMVLVLGDRFEILAAATAAHLNRVPIAHIGGGDVTIGSYDDAMRDCISRMTTIHFVTSERAQWRLATGCDIHGSICLVGSPGVDYIKSGAWKKGRPIAEPYVVVSYQAETIDDTVDLDAVNAAIAGRRAVWITPNPDRGNDRIPAGETFAHDDFLNLIYHCEEFIGNSSAMLYEAPFFDPPVKCRMIGKRQQGRAQPFGDGHACERIIKVLKDWKP